MATIHPLTPKRWPHLLDLFGKGGPSEGCWCMFWRQTAGQHQKDAGAANRDKLKVIVEDRPPGLLAYEKGTPVGWCSIAPRTEFGRVERSRTLKPIDDEPVWSIVCFYIKPSHRHRGLTGDLLDAAIDFAAGRGAKIVEGYPVDAEQRPVVNSDAYTGLMSAFLNAGFQEVARRSDARPIMRLHL